MNRLTCLTLALAAGVVAFPALATADARVVLSPDAVAAHAAAGAALHTSTQRAAQPANAQSVGAMVPKAMGTNTFPGSPFVNGFRAYPPSCAADPLPDKASGPTYAQRVSLFARDQHGAGYVENVTVTVWRLACSSSGTKTLYNPAGAYNGMTLMRIDRDASVDHSRTIFPTFPIVMASQNGSTFGGTASLVRSAVEPNTVISDTGFDSSVFDSTTYVLENYPYTGSGYFKFSDAFTLRIDPAINGVAPVDISVPDYIPTQATYPDAYNPLFLDGYAAAQWVNMTLNEGLIVQVPERYDASHPTRRQLGLDLLTQDLSGNPLWLIGNAAFEIGTVSLTVNLAYLGPGLVQKPWGTAQVTLKDCNHINLTFTANAQLPAPIPSFNGLTTYDRLFSPNGMLCE
ncbi:hypothetical protein [Dokdonella soli]